MMLRRGNTMLVFKNGRSTGATAGLALAIEPSVNIGYMRIEAENVECHTVSGKALSVVTRPEGGEWFAHRGDSGSLVLDSQARGVGLLLSIQPLYNAAHVTPWEAVKKDMTETLAEVGWPVKELDFL